MKKFLLFCLALTLIESVNYGQAQERTVTGKVTSVDDGEALPGVNVVLKGTSTGTVTDIDGNYSISVPQNGGTLVFSFIGLLSEEIATGARSSIDIQMSSDVKQLSEVVVVGYGETRRKDLTGSVASIRGEVIESMPVPGIDQALQGRIAGVNVIKANGQPGGGISIRVRGPASINSNNQPLYVVDGIPLLTDDVNGFNGGNFGGFGGQSSNTMSQINFNDIESVEVLKDASASAIYGSRAANGVVLITTKKGKAGKPQIDANYTVGFQEVFDLPRLANTAEYKELLNESRTNVGLAAQPDDFFDETTDVDWQDEIFRTARIEQFNLSARGGSEKMNYFASVGVDNQEGTLKGTDYQRLSARLNLESRASDKVKFGNNLTLSYTRDRIQSNDNFIIGPYYTALRARPDLPVFNDDGTFAASNTFDNPVAATTYFNEFNNYRIIGNAYLEYEPIENLKLRGSAGIDYVNILRDMYWPSYTFGGGLFGFGYAERGFEEAIKTLVDFTATYNFDLGEEHTLSVLGGASWETFTRLDASAGATGFPNDILTTLNSAATPISTTGNATEWGLNSFFGRASYSFKNRYLFNGTVRTDGSSRFGEDNQYGVFPSVGVGWRISQEDFLSGNSFIDDLKLRASWGLTGNNKIGNFASLAQFGGGVAYAGGGGTIPSQVANSELQWETTTKYDLGVDFSFFNARIKGSVDYYYNKTEDILLTAPLPRSSGFNSVSQNVGEMENRGIEVEISGDLIRSNDFIWTMSGNIAFNQNEVLKLVDGEDIAATGFNQSIVREGEPLGSFFGYVVEGIIQTQEELDALNLGSSTGIYQTSGTAPGDFRYADLDGDGRITSGGDQTVIGNAQPDFFGGFTNTFSYKGITLSAFFQFTQGNEIFNFTRQEQAVMENTSNVYAEVMNRWTPDNRDTDLPRVAAGDPNQNERNSSFNVEDGSYIRLKTLNLSYELPQSLLANTFIRSINVFAQGVNLWTLTDYSGADPEVNTFGQNVSTAQGVDNVTYPGGKTYTFGVKLGL